MVGLGVMEWYEEEIPLATCHDLIFLFFAMCSIPDEGDGQEPVYVIEAPAETRMRDFDIQANNWWMRPSTWYHQTCF